MTYNTLYENPWERATITYPYVYWDDGFTNEELNKIINYCEHKGLQRAVTIGADSIKDKQRIEQVRRCDVKFHSKNEENSWFFERLNFIIKSLNDRYYNFDLNGYAAFQYTSYNSKELGKYGWHMDTHLGPDALPADMHEPRKLSLTLLLNEPGKDFQGGEFQLNISNEKHPITVPFKKGRAVVFPSFLLHQVTPVTKGFRKSAVVWVTGPKFK
jgi:PKHD-type hydroxylase